MTFLRGLSGVVGANKINYTQSFYNLLNIRLIMRVFLRRGGHMPPSPRETPSSSARP
jgi:hypothetical protein